MAGRQLFAVLFAAHAAGAEIISSDDGIKCTPNNDRARAILGSLFNRGDKPDKAPVYAAREYALADLIPDHRAFVWDELRAFAWQRWTAKDPEFGRAGRGWLALQNVRGLAMFQGIGIGFPKATAKPVLTAERITLNWHREIGPIEFHVSKLDGGRWTNWRKIVSGEWPHGTTILNERDGQLRATISYRLPMESVTVDAERCAVVIVDGERMLITGPDGETDEIGMREVIDWLVGLAIQRNKWERRRACTGSPKKPWGEPRRFRAIAEHQRRVTNTRENGQSHRSHAWSKRIVARAVGWRCGMVRFVSPEKSELAGMPFAWSGFADKLRYKLEFVGCSLKT